MTRLLVHVEGQTEESFVNEVLAPHLYDRGFSLVGARLMGNARQRDHRGGIRGWPSARRDIVRHLHEDQDRIVTTMVDYYGLPQSGGGAWPGRAEASQRPFADRASSIQDALLADIAGEMGGGFDTRRFVPYVMMHEYEALLFSDCERFGTGIERPDLTPRLQDIRNTFPTPEEIDESPEGAPSKRIMALIDGYEKPLLGILAALEIGLQRMCTQCPHFSDWLNRLESLHPTGEGG